MLNVPLSFTQTPFSETPEAQALQLPLVQPSTLSSLGKAAPALSLALHVCAERLQYCVASQSVSCQHEPLMQTPALLHLPD
jgi:hypothetical protein